MCSICVYLLKCAVHCNFKKIDYLSLNASLSSLLSSLLFSLPSRAPFTTALYTIDYTTVSLSFSLLCLAVDNALPAISAAAAAAAAPLVHPDRAAQFLVVRTRTLLTLYSTLLYCTAFAYDYDDDDDYTRNRCSRIIFCVPVECRLGSARLASRRVASLTHSLLTDSLCCLCLSLRLSLSSAQPMALRGRAARRGSARFA